MGLLHERLGLPPRQVRQVADQLNGEPETTVLGLHEINVRRDLGVADVLLLPAGDEAKRALEAGGIAGGEELIGVRAASSPPISFGRESSRSNTPSEDLAWPFLPPVVVAEAVYIVFMRHTPSFAYAVGKPFKYPCGKAADVAHGGVAGIMRRSCGSKISSYPSLSTAPSISATRVGEGSSGKYPSLASFRATSSGGRSVSVGSWRRASFRAFRMSSGSGSPEAGM